jgi:hypothetical protein
MIARAVLLQSLVRRERETGDDAPEGLPLICRFSPGKFSPGLAPSLEWRTLILVTLCLWRLIEYPASAGATVQGHALSLPGKLLVHLLIKY